MRIYLSVAIRFALLSEQGSKSFINGRELDYSLYKNSVLDIVSLRRRFYLLKNVALPSLSKLADDIKAGCLPIRFRVTIVSSALLPEEIINALNGLVATYPFLQLELQDENSANIKRPLIRTFNNIKEKSIYVTARMDDDDAISSNFYEQLTPYLNVNYSGHAVSFASGYFMMLDHELKCVGFSQSYSPKIAIFLCYITMVDPASPPLYKTIYCLQNHTKIDYKVPVILDARKPTFIRTVHPYSDTYLNQQRYQDAIEKIETSIDELHVKQQFIYSL